ncbi:solute carrier organic anion transporter family member 4C1 isoform X1 [Hydra vulgaris]|uniref:solute carrier organic anion transporter family member 4C1 isoform X1 n=2 Tax=Hydra vulgaris TaxID=6087 RepID=UPI001F5FD150|nr:solute carrier organic anion transporter family member 4C1 isoform X1 [Hydra vulgaris]
MVVDTLLSNDEKNKSDDLRFGIRTWRPDCIQKFNSIVYFLFALCLFSFSQGAVVNGIVTASIASIEKEFGLNSKVIGIIVSGNDASSLMVVGFVSFFGSVHNKAFMISVGAFITGFGALMFALPKFISGDYYPKNVIQNEIDICRLNKTTMDCEIMPVNNINAVVFFIANFIMGAGTTPLYTLGPAYLDENVSPKVAPICIGVLFASSILGRGFGYIISSVFLRIFTNIHQKTLLTVKDSEWVGAWWLGLFLMFSLLIISGFLLLFFPKQLPGGVEKRELAKQQGNLPLSDSNVKYTIKGFIVESFKLLKNKVFMFSIMGLTAKTLYGVSIGTFFAKLLIIKFGVSPDKASMILGAVLLPIMMGGVLGGSFMMRKWKLKAAGKTSMKFCFIASVVGGIFSVLFLIPGCRNTNLAGVIVPYPNQMLENSLNSQCNSNCTCSEKNYLPVCGSDGITYSSPCYAGCQTLQKEKGKVAYFRNCSCVANSNKKSFNFTDQYNYATPGKCERNCKNAYIFVLSTAFVIALSFLAGTPHKIAVLRCVPDNHRAFALGMQFMIMRSISFLPGPIILGAVIDSQCITWSYGECGKKLNCLDYNSDRLSFNLVLFGVATSVVGSILYFLAWWCYPKLSSDNDIKFSELKDNVIN